MTRPRIGITVDHITGKPHYTLPFGYADAVERAGGLPLMMPYRGDASLIPQYLDQFDGVLLAGGDDLDPHAWGEEWHPKVKRIDPQRAAWEFALLAEIERRRTPTLGICMGCQIMNVYRGGSLIQFLPDELGEQSFDHRLNDDWSRRHAVQLDRESGLASVLGKTRIDVNTAHKQSVRTVGRGLRIIATAPDGVIEGIEDPSLELFVGVQWHPERQADEPDQLRLFELLVERSLQLAGG